jgi:hypothetical protein
MRRMLFGTLGLLVLVAGHAEAQRCRRYVGGTVVVCDRERERDHERRRHGDWDRGPIEFGIRGGYDFDGSQGSAGTQVRVPLIPQLVLAPSFDVYFGDDTGATWQLNGDAVIRPDQLGGVYFGGGAAAVRREFDPAEGTQTRAGWNLLLGIDGGRVSGSSLRPFAEGRWTGVGDFTAFRLVAGVNVPIGGFGRW